MTPQEQEMLQGLIQRVNQTRLEEKDLDAEEMLNQTSWAATRMRCTSLPRPYSYSSTRSTRPRSSSISFASSLAEPPAFSAVCWAVISNLPRLRHLHRLRTRPSRNMFLRRPAGGYGGPQSGGFLRGAMQTAAGVAAGAFAFEAIEGLMHGFGHQAGYGSGFGSFGDSDRPEIINNYYGDNPAGGHEGSLSPDIEDRRGESAFSQHVDSNDHGDSFMDNGDNTTDDFADDSSLLDDSSSFDDGFDSGGDDSSF